MRTIIHIGQHKTGTTSIQHFLRQHREDLAGRGLYVPDSVAGHDNPSHYILNVYALEEDRYSTVKETLLKIKPKEYFLELQRELRRDVSRHYELAQKLGCRDVIWSNEGLYLLNSISEYVRLRELFDPYSSSVVCVCCFREVESYRKSYIQQLEKQGLTPSENTDSYRYVEEDSWLFDYSRKMGILNEVFDQLITFDYNKQDNVKSFFEEIGYPVGNAESIRLNET